MRYLLFIAMLMTVQFSVAGEYKPATEINKELQSPELVGVKAIEAIVNNDKDAYLALCDEYTKGYYTKHTRMWDQLVVNGKKYDFSKIFDLKISKIDIENQKYNVRVKMQLKDTERIAYKSITVVKIDDKYFVCLK